MRNGDIAGDWSPDSKWLAYSKVLPNELSADSPLLARRRQIHPDHRRHERRHQPRVRQGRQVSLLHRQHQFGRKPRPSISTPSAAPPPVRSIWSFSTSLSPRPFAPESDEEKPRGRHKSDAAARRRPAEAAKRRRPRPPMSRSISTASISASSPCPCRRAATPACRWPKPESCSRWKRRHRPAAARPAVRPGSIVHRYDLKARKSDTPLTGITASRCRSAARRRSTGRARTGSSRPCGPWPTAPAALHRPPPPRRRRRAGQGALKTASIEVRVDPVAGMEADVSRGLADRTRLVLRPQYPRPRYRSGGEEVRAVSARRRLAQRPHLPVPGNARQHGGQPHGHRRRRHCPR